MVLFWDSSNDVNSRCPKHPILMATILGDEYCCICWYIRPVQMKSTGGQIRRFETCGKFKIRFRRSRCLLDDWTFPRTVFWIYRTFWNLRIWPPVDFICTGLIWDQCRWLFKFWNSWNYDINFSLVAFSPSRHQCIITPASRPRHLFWYANVAIDWVLLDTGLKCQDWRFGAHSKTRCVVVHNDVFWVLSKLVSRVSVIASMLLTPFGIRAWSVSLRY